MVTAGMTPRQAVGEVEARLTAAGCPDADYDARELFRLAAGRDARLSDRLLSDEEANQLEVLCARREQREPLQYLCGTWSFLDLIWRSAPGCSARGRTPKWWPKPQPERWPALLSQRFWISVQEPAVWGWA